MRSLYALIFVLISCFSSTAWSEASDTELKEAIGYLTQGNESKFYEMLDSMIRRGDVKAKILYAAIKIRKEEFDEAIKMLQPLAVSGNAEAQYYLGMAYSAKGSDEGKIWLETSAKQGYYKAIDVLNATAVEPEVIDGKIKIDDLAKMSLEIVPKKLARLSDENLSCYKMSRENLISSYKDAVGVCVKKAKDEVGETYPAEEMFNLSQFLANCTNTLVFERVGITATSLTNCLK
jgi:TPR repeat protein